MKTTLLPWVFFGPLFAMIVSYAAYALTRWPAAGLLAQVFLAVTLLVALGAAATWWLRCRGRTPRTSQDSQSREVQCQRGKQDDVDSKA